MSAHIVNVLINLIRDYVYVRIFCNYISQSLQFALRVDATSRVRWRAEYKSLGLRCYGSFKLCGCHLKVLLNACFYKNIGTVSQFYHLSVAYPVWSWDNHLIAGAYDRQNHVAHALLCTVRAKNLCGIIIKIVLCLQLFCNGLT